MIRSAILVLLLGGCSMSLTQAGAEFFDLAKQINTGANP